MKEQYGFKVCREHNGKYYSATICGHTIEYKVGVEASPEPYCGPLAVFGTYIRALRFAMMDCYIDETIVIFLCVFEQSKHDCLWTLDPVGKVYSRGQDDLPVGTIFADKVMLVQCPFRRFRLEKIRID